MRYTVTRTGKTAANIPCSCVRTKYGLLRILALKPMGGKVVVFSNLPKCLAGAWVGFRRLARRLSMMAILLGRPAENCGGKI